MSRTNTTWRTFWLFLIGVLTWGLTALLGLWFCSELHLCLWNRTPTESLLWCTGLCAATFAGSSLTSLASIQVSVPTHGRIALRWMLCISGLAGLILGIVYVGMQEGMKAGNAPGWLLVKMLILLPVCWMLGWNLWWAWEATRRMQTVPPTEGEEPNENGPLVAGIVLLVLLYLGVFELSRPNMIESPKAGNETSAAKALKTLVDAEANFRKADYDHTGKDFCWDLGRLHDLPDTNGCQIELIPSSLAHGQKEGYVYGMFRTCDEKGERDRKNGFAYYGTPLRHGETGRRTYIANHTGNVWYRDLEGAQPPIDWPAKGPAADGWTLLGE